MTHRAPHGGDCHRPYSLRICRPTRAPGHPLDSPGLHGGLAHARFSSAENSVAGMKEAQMGHQWGAHVPHSLMNGGVFAHQSDESHTKTEWLTAPWAITSKVDLKSEIRTPGFVEPPSILKIRVPS